MKTVCHMSSVHNGLDVRIFLKECSSLAQAGYDVHLVIAASEEEGFKAQQAGVTLHRLPRSTSRLGRILKNGWQCYQLARRTKADIYHFHDAELIPYGILLSLAGKAVVYDVHEDLPKDILTKEWIAPVARNLMARVAAGFEYIGARWFFSVVAATPSISARFRPFARRIVNINNFPLFDELIADPELASEKRPQVCYVGGITKIRGVQEVVQSLGLTRSGVRLQLAGSFTEPDFELAIKQEAGWNKVDALGWQNRSAVARILSQSMAGLVTFLPVPNHLDAQPNKMFEYMSAGLPVIASDFPLWRDIIEGNNCGLCVDPANPQAIAGAIDFLLENPERAREMGRNGRSAVETHYNWKHEEAKLLGFYKEIQCCF